MTAYKNMTFALEIKKLPKEEIEQRVTESLAEVQMEGYADRYPREMSGDSSSGSRWRACWPTGPRYS